jgi:hypothetical protein
MAKINKIIEDEEVKNLIKTIDSHIEKSQERINVAFEFEAFLADRDGRDYNLGSAICGIQYHLDFLRLLRCFKDYCENGFINVITAARYMIRNDIPDVSNSAKEVNDALTKVINGMRERYCIPVIEGEGLYLFFAVYINRMIDCLADLINQGYDKDTDEPKYYDRIDVLEKLLKDII